MRRFPFPHGFALSVLITGVLASVSVAGAQSKPEAVELVSLRPGTIFEIYAHTASSNTQVSWVLTKNGEFTRADRGSIFSFRPSEAGQYLLSGEMTEQAQPPVRTMFRLDVRQDVPLIELASKEEENALTRVFPAPDADGIVSLTGTNRLIRIDAIQNDIELLALDANTEADTSGDGDTQNDNVLSKSIFSSGEGSLHVWLPKNLSSQKMLLAAKRSNGSFATQPIHIVTDTYYEMLSKQAEAEELARKERTQITATERSGDTYKISVQTEEGVLPQAPLLYFWDFGDGTQSLLNKPEHVYADTDREYRITLRIVNLTNGTEVLNATQMVYIGKSLTPDVTVPPVQEPDTEPDVPPPAQNEEKESDTKEKGSLVSTVIKAVLGLAASVGIGMLAVFLFAKVKGKSLQESLEKVEKKLVGTEDVTLPALPMEIAATPADAEIMEENEDGIEEEIENEIKKEVEEEATKPEVPQEKTPEIHRQVPSWLAPSPAEGVDVPASPPPPPPPKPTEPVQQTTPSPPSTTPIASEASQTTNQPKEPAEAPTPPPTPPWLAGTENISQQSPPPPSSPPTPASVPQATSHVASAHSEKKDIQDKKLPTETPPQTKGDAQEKITSDQPQKKPVSPALATPPIPTTPPWLTNIPSTPKQPHAASPPPAESIAPDFQAEPVSAPTPPWLTDTSKTQHPEVTPSQAAPAQPETLTPSSQPVTTPEATPIPAWLTETPKKQPPANTSAPAPITPSPTSSHSTVTPAPPAAGSPDSSQYPATNTKESPGEMSKEEREMERKRKKRQRYRTNKRERERADAAEPAADTQAENTPAAAPVPAWLQSTPATPTNTQPPTPKKKEELPPPPPPQSTSESIAPPPSLQQQEAASASPPEATKKPRNQQSSAPVPAWLKMEELSPSAPEQDVPAHNSQNEPADEDIKFVISADSLEQEKPPLPPEGDIPLQEKEGE